MKDVQYYTHIFNGCYAGLMFIVVVFFLIYGVEVFFKVGICRNLEKFDAFGRKLEVISIYLFPPEIIVQFQKKLKTICDYICTFDLFLFLSFIVCVQPILFVLLQSLKNIDSFVLKLIVHFPSFCSFSH